MSVDDLLREEQDRAFVLGLPNAQLVATINPGDRKLFIEDRTGLYLISRDSEAISFSGGEMSARLQYEIGGAFFWIVEISRMRRDASHLSAHGINLRENFNKLLESQDGPLEIVCIDGAYHFMKLVGNGDKPRYRRIAMYNSNGKA